MLASQKPVTAGGGPAIGRGHVRGSGSLQGRLIPANPRWARARAAAAAWLTSFRPRRADLKSDLLAGLPGAISSVPDGMAASVLAAARTLQLRLPDAGTAEHAAVILRLCRRTTLGAKFLTVIGAYVQRLDSLGGRLDPSGLDESVATKWESNHLLERIGSIKLYRATPQIGQSTHAAFLSAASHSVLPTQEA